MTTTITTTADGLDAAIGAASLDALTRLTATFDAQNCRRHPSHFTHAVTLARDLHEAIVRSPFDGQMGDELRAYLQDHGAVTLDSDGTELRAGPHEIPHTARVRLRRYASAISAAYACVGHDARDDEGDETLITEQGCRAQCIDAETANAAFAAAVLAIGRAAARSEAAEDAP